MTRGRGLVSVRTSVLIAIFVLIPQLAAASTPISADFVARGVIQLPLASELTVAPVAALVVDTAKLAFVLSTPSLRVCEYARDSPELSTGDLIVTSEPLRMDSRCYTQTQVRVELEPDGDHAGWLGFYPKQGARFHLGSASFDARSSSTIASPEASVGSSVEDAPGQMHYYQRIFNEHLFMVTAGEAHYEGAGALKVKGPDLVVVAAENTTRHETHSRVSNDGPVRERQERWLYLEFEEASIEMYLLAPMTVAARQATGDWDGRFSLQSLEGLAVARSGEYRATGRDGWFEGSFSGTFLPLHNERVRLVFSGEMRATSIPFEPGPVVPALDGFSLLGLVAVVLGGALVAGGGFLAVKRQRNGQLALRGGAKWPRPDILPAPPARGDAYALRANEAALKAHEAADQRQWVIAADLMERARHEDDRPDLAYWHGRYLHQAGMFQHALEALDAASYGVDSGEAEYFAACCVLELLRQEAERVADLEGTVQDRMRGFYALQEKGAYYLMRAFERTQKPSIVMEIAMEPEFRELFWKESVQESFDHACERLSIR